MLFNTAPSGNDYRHRSIAFNAKGDLTDQAEQTAKGKATTSLPTLTILLDPGDPVSKHLRLWKSH